MGAFYQTGDVVKLDDGRNRFFGITELREFLQTLVGHRHDADIRVNRGEGVIGDIHLLAGYDFKKRGFTDVGKTDYANG